MPVQINFALKEYPRNKHHLLQDEFLLPLLSDDKETLLDAPGVREIPLEESARVKRSFVSTESDILFDILVYRRLSNTDKSSTNALSKEQHFISRQIEIDQGPMPLLCSTKSMFRINGRIRR